MATKADFGGIVGEVEIVAGHAPVHSIRRDEARKRRGEWRESANRADAHVGCAASCGYVASAQEPRRLPGAVRPCRGADEKIGLCGVGDDHTKADRLRPQRAARPVRRVGYVAVHASLTRAFLPIDGVVSGLCAARDHPRRFARSRHPIEDANEDALRIDRGGRQLPPQRPDSDRRASRPFGHGVVAGGRTITSMNVPTGVEIRHVYWTVIVNALAANRAVSPLVTALGVVTAPEPR